MERIPRNYICGTSIPIENHTNESRATQMSIIVDYMQQFLKNCLWIHHPIISNESRTDPLITFCYTAYTGNIIYYFKERKLTLLSFLPPALHLFSHTRVLLHPVSAESHNRHPHKSLGRTGRKFKYNRHSVSHSIYYSLIMMEVQSRGKSYPLSARVGGIISSQLGLKNRWNFNKKI